MSQSKFFTIGSKCSHRVLSFTHRTVLEHTDCILFECFQLRFVDQYIWNKVNILQ